MLCIDVSLRFEIKSFNIGIMYHQFNLTNQTFAACAVLRANSMRKSITIKLRKRPKSKAMSIMWPLVFSLKKCLRDWMSCIDSRIHC